MGSRLEADIKTIARSIIQGNEKRKKRIKTKTASAFDVMAAAPHRVYNTGSRSHGHVTRERKAG